MAVSSCCLCALHILYVFEHNSFINEQNSEKFVVYLEKIQRIILIYFLKTFCCSSYGIFWG